MLATLCGICHETGETMAAPEGNSNDRKGYFIYDPSPDHRTLFSWEEVEAAYRRALGQAEAAEATRLTMEGPIVPRQPAFFTDYLLDLLAALSDDAARRVRIARGEPQEPSK
jgi:hypothetical protein